MGMVLRLKAFLSGRVSWLLVQPIRQAADESATEVVVVVAGMGRCVGHGQNPPPSASLMKSAIAVLASALATLSRDLFS